jgi:hypothetical protein
LNALKRIATEPLDRTLIVMELLVMEPIVMLSLGKTSIAIQEAEREC